jgi:hypothetical protein
MDVQSPRGIYQLGERNIMNVKIENFMTMQRVSLFMCKESRDWWMTMCMATLSNTYECQYLRYP